MGVTPAGPGSCASHGTGDAVSAVPASIANVDDPVTKWMRDNNVRDVIWLPVAGEFLVLLRCGGPGGYGETAANALADANAKNAEWLDAPWLDEAA